MPFRVLRAIKLLKIAVEVGFVVGTIPAITPKGSAIFTTPASGSCSTTPHVRAAAYLLKMYSAAKWFLITLSSKIPIPLSSAAIRAKAMRFSFAACAAWRKIKSTISCLNSANFFCAASTRSTKTFKSSVVLTIISTPVVGLNTNR